MSSSIFNSSASSKIDVLKYVYVSGLFHQAIYQSGTDLNPWSVNGPDSAPETYIYPVAEYVGCGDEAAIGNEEMLECMRQLDAELILAASVKCVSLSKLLKYNFRIYLH